MPWRIVDRLKAPAPDPDRVRWLQGATFAHRGVHGGRRPENSRAAFAAAIAAGHGIECDVRKSRDGRAVVFHDAQLDRLTGLTGAIDALDVAEITAIPLRGSDEHIPTLRDLLDQVAGQAPLLIEVKTDPAHSVAALCLAVRRDLEGYGGSCAVMSFDPRVGRWFARVAPHILRGLVITEENARTLGGALRRHRMLWQARAQFLAYDVRDLPSRFARQQRDRGLPIATWTVGTAALRDRALAHADALIAEHDGLD